MIKDIPCPTINAQIYKQICPSVQVPLKLLFGGDLYWRYEVDLHLLFVVEGSSWYPALFDLQDLLKHQKMSILEQLDLLSVQVYQMLPLLGHLHMASVLGTSHAHPVSPQVDGHVGSFCLKMLRKSTISPQAN
jgi:hypothetical protein